ncbi:MAG: hypothetical protein RLZZ546_1398 [Bacteroidota bacterium]|jgi:LAO/AO transport system kinase
MSNESNFNPNFIVKSKENKALDYYINGIKNSDRFILSEAITLIESENESKKNLALEILKNLAKDTNNESIRIAVTGSPGVGKSTFIENFGIFLTEQDCKIAVLAIDPSSQQNKGSILGDKTRMEHLSNHDNAFIRPSSSGALLGGVARGTKEAILLCEAAGFRYIIIETVGIGQSEYWASKLADLTLLLIQPGSGDEVQGIKRGILEMADIIVVNKSDGEQLKLANETAKNYENVINLFHSRLNHKQKVISISSIERKNFDLLKSCIDSFIELSKSTDFFLENRKNQEIFWFDILIKEKIFSLIMKDQKISEPIAAIQAQVTEGKISTFESMIAVEQLFKKNMEKD